MHKSINIIAAFILASISTTVVAANNDIGFQQRSDILVKTICNYGWMENDQEYRMPGWDGCKGSGSVVSDFGKYVYPWLMAQYEKNGKTALQGQQVAKIRKLMYREAHTCPTFHFNLIGLPRLIYQYPFIPYLNKESNGGHLKAYLEKVFERTDSYNAFTCEGTENHVNMSRCPGYLYAQIAIDSGYADAFDAWDPEKMLDTMKHWIMTHSRKIYQTGAAEWNSSKYGIYNILGWLSLYDFAKDPEVKKAAKAMLDYYAAELALHYTQGMTGGAEMRGGGSTSSAATETDILGFLWFGDIPQKMIPENISSSTARQSIHAATSSYRPPEVACQLARKEIPEEPAMYHNSKGGFLYQDPSMIKQTFFISNNYTLGAAYTPYGGWSGGDWQIISWKLAARVQPTSTHNTQYISGGMQKGNYIKPQVFKQPWKQLVHHKNVLIQMTQRPTDHSHIKDTIKQIFDMWDQKWYRDFIQRFSEQDDKITEVGHPVHFQEDQASHNQTLFTYSVHGTLNTKMTNNILFMEFDKIFTAIRSIHRKQPTSPKKKKDFKYIKDYAPDGQLTGLVMEVADKQDFKNFKNFRKHFTQNTQLHISDKADHDLTYISLKQDTLQVTYQENGTFTEPYYDCGYGPTKEMFIHRAPPFKIPDFSDINQGTNATWSVNSGKVDLDEDWAVYEGPHCQLKNRQLLLTGKQGKTYKVDYSGDVPIFDE